MRRSWMLILATALLTLLPVPIATAGKGGTQRPFTASLTGAVTYLVPAGCPGDPADIANCTAFTTNTAATGQVTHLGLVEAYFSHRPYDFDNHHDGAMRLTAANGDTLDGVYDYDLSGDGPIAITLTGGTGRFADASGTISMTAEAIPRFKPSPCDRETDFFGCLNPDVPWPWTGTMTGTISY